MSNALARRLCCSNAAVFAALGVLEAFVLAPAESMFGIHLASPFRFTAGVLAGVLVACLLALILALVVVGGSTLRAASAGIAIAAVSVVGAVLVGTAGKAQILSVTFQRCWPFVAGTGALFGIVVRWAYRVETAPQ